MAASVNEKLLEIVPEKEQVVRKLITMVGNDRNGLKSIHEIIEHIAIKEYSQWAFMALATIEKELGL